MGWRNPFTWFRRPTTRPSTEPDSRPQFSRSARDSTNIPMDVVFTMRIPDELRERGARRAREMGLSFGEYMRLLLTQDLNAQVHSNCIKAIRKEDSQAQ